MIRHRAFAYALAAVTAGGLAGTAQAWEAQTTQAGLAEQAALSSRLHKRLVTLGFTGGLFEPLTIPPADAPVLIADLHLLSPSHGGVPDGRGRQTALSWLAAGAALADIPASQAANHFYDPTTKRGFDRPDRSLGDDIADAIDGVSLPAHGVPAPDWIVDTKNPFNVDRFVDEYAKAVTGATPGERSRSMAGALISAGALMHVLGDLGVPARVRGDGEAQLDRLGGGNEDRGSRFERMAALVYGRLGVPGPARTITRVHLRDYFTSHDGDGLADVIARSYFSPNTLPEPARVTGYDDVSPKLVRPKPALPAKLNLMAASRESGTTLRAPDGTCLARYKVDHSLLTFSLDDDCMLEQLAAILPEVTAYETGLLDFLLRGELAISVSQQVVVSAKGLGAGSLTILVEDDRGVRRSIGEFPVVPGKDELAKIAAPTSGSRVVAMYRGVDLAGEPLIAVGALPLTTH